MFVSRVEPIGAPVARRFRDSVGFVFASKGDARRTLHEALEWGQLQP